MTGALRARGPDSPTALRLRCQSSPPPRASHFGADSARLLVCWFVWRTADRRLLVADLLRRARSRPCRLRRQCDLRVRCCSSPLHLTAPRPPAYTGWRGFGPVPLLAEPTARRKCHELSNPCCEWRVLPMLRRARISVMQLASVWAGHLLRHIRVDPARVLVRPLGSPVCPTSLSPREHSLPLRLARSFSLA